MKKLKLLPLFLCLLLTSCGGIKNPALQAYYDLASSGGGKGIEIFFFEVEEERRFVMLPGTNRYKFAEEINALPLATFTEMKDIVGTMSETNKECVSVRYVASYPCDDDTLRTSYAYSEETSALIGLVQLQLGLA